MKNFIKTHIPELVTMVAITFVVFGAILFSGIQSAHANPSYFVRSLGTNSASGAAAATSSVKYLTPGTGTTTESWNTQTGSTQVMNSALLELVLTGSTSVNSLYATTTFKVAIEYSDNGVDWSQDTYINGTELGTTTSNLDFSPATTRTISLGTATLGGTPLATTSPTVRFINVPTPTPYVRAVTSIPAGSTNGAVYQRFIGQRENN